MTAERDEHQTCRPKGAGDSKDQGPDSEAEVPKAAPRSRECYDRSQEKGQEWLFGQGCEAQEAANPENREFVLRAEEQPSCQRERHKAQHLCVHRVSVRRDETSACYKIEASGKEPVIRRLDFAPRKPRKRQPNEEDGERPQRR